MDSEQIVLLNDDWQQIGVAPKLASHTASTPLHLAFSCYVFDERGKLLVTQRAHHKKVWPGFWTNSCCGHPAPGETLESAVQRRLQYELGLKVKELELVLPRFRYSCEYGGVVENECCPVFMARAVSDPLPNPDEVADWTWMSWQEFTNNAFTNKLEYSEWCRLQIPLLKAARPSFLTD